MESRILTDRTTTTQNIPVDALTATEAGPEPAREASYVSSDNFALGVVVGLTQDVLRSHSQKHPDDPLVPADYLALRHVERILEERIRAALAGTSGRTGMLGHKMTDRPELDALIRKSVAAFQALSPEEQKAHLKLQAESWARGEAGIAAAERAEGGRRTVTLPNPSVERGN